MKESNLIRLKGASPLAAFVDSFQGVCESIVAFDPKEDKGYGNILQLTLRDGQSKRIVRLMSGNIIGASINGKPITGTKDVPVEAFTKAIKGLQVKYDRNESPAFRAVQAEDKPEKAKEKKPEEEGVFG